MMSFQALRTAVGAFLPCVALAGAGTFLHLSEAAERPGPAAALAPADFAKLHALVRPHADEARCRWMTDIAWETGLWEARQKAAAQGKPILVVGSGGGSPLGRC